MHTLNVLVCGFTCYCPLLSGVRKLTVSILVSRHMLQVSKHRNVLSALYFTPINNWVMSRKNMHLFRELSFFTRSGAAGGGTRIFWGRLRGDQFRHILAIPMEENTCVKPLPNLLFVWHKHKASTLGALWWFLRHMTHFPQLLWRLHVCLDWSNGWTDRQMDGHTLPNLLSLCLAKAMR